MAHPFKPATPDELATRGLNPDGTPLVKPAKKAKAPKPAEGTAPAPAAEE